MPTVLASVTLLAVVTLTGPSVGSERCEPPRRPDIVVVIGDDIARSDLDVVPTPNLERLARQGVTFQRAYSHPLCSPTRRSLFFGRWPGRHAQRTCGSPGADSPHHSEYSLGKLMKAAGYATGAFGKWHLGSNEVTTWEATPQLHGFDVWRAGLPSNVTHCGGGSYADWLRVDDGFSTLTSEYQTDAVRDAFRDWWLATPSPRFAFVAYQAAHGPYHDPSFKGGPSPPGLPPVPARLMYEAMIQSLDEAVGEMLRVIDLDETVLFFVGDNGTPWGAVRVDQDRSKVKPTTFEDGVNVPLIAAGPGIAAGAQTAELVHTVDFLATIAALARQRVPRHLGLDSRSFHRLLARPTEARSRRPFVYCENDTAGFPHDRAVVTERYKLRNVDGLEELYDRREDPREERPLDLADPSLAPLLARLRATLTDPSRRRLR